MTVAFDHVNAFCLAPEFQKITTWVTLAPRQDAPRSSGRPVDRETIMPLYFFHLSFGDRLLSDEEGVELESRAAARAEALAVIRDMSSQVFSTQVSSTQVSSTQVASGQATGRNSRRWAGWFLRVADGRGQFLRLPMDPPALKVASTDRHAAAPDPNLEQAQPTRPCDQQTTTPLPRHADHTARLLEENRVLRSQLAFQFLVSEKAYIHSRQLLARARLVRSPVDFPMACRHAVKRIFRRPPHLLVLQGGR